MQVVKEGSNAATTTDDGWKDYTIHNRLIEDIKPLAANLGGLKLPQEV